MRGVRRKSGRADACALADGCREEILAVEMEQVAVAGAEHFGVAFDCEACMVAGSSRRHPPAVRGDFEDDVHIVARRRERGQGFEKSSRTCGS